MRNMDSFSSNDRTDELLREIRAAVAREDHEEVTRLDRTLQRLTDPSDLSGLRSRS
ncbi:hypothetical protein K9B35_00175 [Sphingomonas sp. R647]|uniref:hypothetical protein n=1 Tax=Sphingomonas sp. R647 TaxID=2875233 RepID=UPI001CD37B53|nr:hypothetical protein [Sphingomonas sp. R647]MCA1196370.1 hypothetical protein [Sphingomonas sp. R647]